MGIKNLIKTGKKTTHKIPPLNALEALESLKTLVNAATQNHKITEEQKTIRANIEAQKEIAIEEIRAKKEILLNYFENVFKERRENYKKLFDLLDKGIETNNFEMIQLATNGIVTIALDSPLKELEKFQSNNKIGEKIKKIDNFSI